MQQYIEDTVCICVCGCVRPDYMESIEKCFKDRKGEGSVEKR